MHVGQALVLCSSRMNGHLHMRAESSMLLNRTMLHQNKSFWSLEASVEVMLRCEPGTSLAACKLHTSFRHGHAELFDVHPAGHEHMPLSFWHCNVSRGIQSPALIWCVPLTKSGPSHDYGPSAICSCGLSFPDIINTSWDRPASSLTLKVSSSTNVLWPRLCMHCSLPLAAIAYLGQSQTMPN